jgi:predicted amidohydrolase
VAQIACRLGQLDANLAKVESAVEQAEAAGVELLIFPELSLSGYPPGDWFAEASVSRDSDHLARLRELSRRVSMVVGLIEETEHVEFYNSALYLHQGAIRHLHRKVYLPNYRIFEERRFFKPGWGVSAFDTPWGRMAVLICGDCWHLTLPYLAVHDGADLLIFIAASSNEGLTENISCRDAWERMNRSYALTLSTFIAFANLAGSSGPLTYWGGSHVVRPDGNLLDQAAIGDEDLLVCDLDFGMLREQRMVLPFRRDDSLVQTVELGREILTTGATRVSGLWQLVEPFRVENPASDRR